MTRQLILWSLLWGAMVYFLFRPSLGWRSIFWSKDKKIKLRVLRELQNSGLDPMKPSAIARYIKRSGPEVAEALQALREEGLVICSRDTANVFSWSPEEWATSWDGMSAYRRPYRLRKLLSRVAS